MNFAAIATLSWAPQHRSICRAAKFGQSITDEDIAKISRSRRPGLLRNELRKELSGQRDHISAGFDMYSQDEMDKQTQRAARFGTSAPSKGVAIAQVPDAELARKRRAKKFGLQYEEPDQAGLYSFMCLDQACSAARMGDVITMHTPPLSWPSTPVTPVSRPVSPQRTLQCIFSTSASLLSAQAIPGSSCLHKPSHKQHPGLGHPHSA